MGRRNRKRKSLSSDDENDDSIEKKYYHEHKKVKPKSRDDDGGNTCTSICDHNKKSTDYVSSSVTRRTEDNSNLNTNNSNTTTTGTCRPTATNTSTPKFTNESINRLRDKKKHFQQLKQIKKQKQHIMIQQNELLERTTTTATNSNKKQKNVEPCIDKKSKKTIVNQNELKFTTTHRGVQYCDILVGDGPILQNNKKITVQYKLHARNLKGKVIDSHSNFRFTFGKNEVIPGWEIGLLRMRQGGTRHIIVPPNAGYGTNRNVGAGKGGLLYFEIILLSC